VYLGVPSTHFALPVSVELVKLASAMCMHMIPVNDWLNVKTSAVIVAAILPTKDTAVENIFAREEYA